MHLIGVDGVAIAADTHLAKRWPKKMRSEAACAIRALLLTNTLEPLVYSLCLIIPDKACYTGFNAAAGAAESNLLSSTGASTAAASSRRLHAYAQPP